MPANLTLALMLVATSLGSALLALVLLSVANLRRAPSRRLSDVQGPMEPTVFLFDDETLVDASGPARTLIETAPPGHSDWSRLCAFLAPRFDGFESEMATLAHRGEVEMRGTGPAPLRLRAEFIGGLARITLTDPEAEGQSALVDALSLRAMEEEIESLRQTAEAMPVLAWRQDAQGAVTWANRAYLDLAGTLDPEAEELPIWPLPRLFDSLPDSGGPARRIRLDRPGGDRPAWFECHSLPMKGDVLAFAVPADTTVRAETALREFVQTLTKTFAHLPIGLAIFDKQRQMALFNPALIDLTTLPPEFLSGRPTLFSFLDRKREARMIPEPKDYRGWRRQMIELEQAASSGLYEETWTLPSGLTYKVTGRPYPDGAFALLFEDISAEISLTRRFRSELELGQAVLDALPEAIAVFSPAGSLVLSNAAYARLWGHDPATTLGEVSVAEATRLWQDQTMPSAIWAEARDFLARVGTRGDWSADIALRDGRVMHSRFSRVGGGASLVSFGAPHAPDRAQARHRHHRTEDHPAAHHAADLAHPGDRHAQMLAGG